MTNTDLQSNEFGAYYANYIALAGDDSLISGLISRLNEAVSLYESISEEQFNSAYAEGKWTIKELLLHVIDSERVFAYRALRIARKDKLNLLGFFQDDFVLASDANNRGKADLIKEFSLLRQSTIALFNSFDDNMLKEIGSASDNPISVRALGFIITGHEKHHSKIVSERYI
jgi:hypothetical protein